MNLKKYCIQLVYFFVYVLFLPVLLFFRIVKTIDMKRFHRLYKFLIFDIYKKQQKLDYFRFESINLLGKEKIRIVNETNDVAIIFQGEIRSCKKYVFQTICLYRKMYPNITIVLSIWDYEFDEHIELLCSKYDVHLLANTVPGKSGLGHVNYQLKGTHEAIKFIQKKYNGLIKYVLRTRTDQRIYLDDFLTYLKNSLITYACTDHTGKLSDRIVVVGSPINSYIWLPFHLCDFMTFSTINNIEKIYSAEYDLHENGIQNVKWFTFFKNIITKYELVLPNHYSSKIEKLNRISDKIYSAEIFLFKNFYNKNIESIHADTLVQQYHSFVKECLVVVDEKTLLLDWPKYLFYIEQKNVFSKGFGGLSHTAWLNIYASQKDKKNEK